MRPEDVDHPDDVLDVGLQPDQRREQVRPLRQPGQRRRVHLVAGRPQRTGHPVPAPAAVPGAVDEDEGAHACASSGTVGTVTPVSACGTVGTATTSGIGPMSPPRRPMRRGPAATSVVHPAGGLGHRSSTSRGVLRPRDADQHRLAEGTLLGGQEGVAVVGLAVEDPRLARAAEAVGARRRHLEARSRTAWRIDVPGGTSSTLPAVSQTTWTGVSASGGGHAVLPPGGGRTGRGRCADATNVGGARDRAVDPAGRSSPSHRGCDK